MVKCGACGKFVSASESVRCIKCTVCAKTFHKGCVSIPESATVKSWICPDCKIKIPREDNSSTPVKGITEAYSASPERLDNIPIHTTENIDLALEIRSFRDELKAIRTEIHECRQDILEFKSMLSSHEARMTTMEGRISVFEEKLSELAGRNVNEYDDTIAELKTQLNDRDQALLCNDIELAGIPEKSQENLMTVVKVLSVKLGVEFDERDLVRVERVGSTFRNRVDEGSIRNGGNGDLTQRPRAIAVRFTRRTTRDQWLSAARVRRNISSADINVPGPPCRVYVNERLSKINRHLFYRARQAGIKLRWKYIWTRDGKIQARKEDGQPAVRIRNEQDVVKFFGIDVV